MAEKKQALLLFSKPPVAGRVKTRLTVEHGGFMTAEEAADFYKTCLYDVTELCMHSLIEMQWANDAAVEADPSADKITYDFFVSTPLVFVVFVVFADWSDFGDLTTCGASSA